MRATRSAWLFVFVVACSGGGGDHTTAPTPALTTLSLALSSSTLEVGEQGTATVTGRDQNGNSIPTGAATWALLPINVASITNQGVIIPLAPGQATVGVTVGKLHTAASLTVTTPAIVSLTARLNNASIEATKTTQASVTAKDARGNTLTGRTIAWSSSNTAAATVSSTGVVTGVAAGNASIIAQAEGRTATVDVTVTPLRILTTLTLTFSNPTPGVGQQSATGVAARDQFGNPIAAGAIAWTSSVPSVASINATGTINALTMGVTNIAATAGAIQGTATLTVNAATIFGTGPWRIGTQVAPGTYRSVSALGTSCHWERLRGFGGTSDEVIANAFGDGPSVTTIAASDVGFNSDHCGTWSPATTPVTSSQTAPFGQGVWVVNLDIAPGTWQSSAGVQSCYWERMRNFTGQNAVIASNTVSGQASVTIDANDVGFTSSKCGTWTKIN